MKATEATVLQVLKKCQSAVREQMDNGAGDE